MNAQLIRRLLAMCLISSMVLSPGLVFWRIWQDHIQVVNAQRVARAGDRVSDSAAYHPVAQPANHYPEFLPTNLDQPSFKPTALPIGMTVSLSFIISVVLGFCSGQWLHHRYQTYRWQGSATNGCSL